MKNQKSAKVAMTIKKVADKMARVSCGSASAWGLHQPKEPKLNK